MLTLCLVDSKLQILSLSCIRAVLKNKEECETTNLEGAFEIIRSILLKNPTPSHIPKIVFDTLHELLDWVSDTQVPAFMRERRLHRVMIFRGLILFCRGEEERKLVDEFREGLDNQIKDIAAPCPVPIPDSHVLPIAPFPDKREGVSRVHPT